MSAQQNPPTIYRLKVTLAETEPAIWRRILVPSTVTLHRLHLILQEVMGWTNEPVSEIGCMMAKWEKVSKYHAI